jgi:hypothetical protein
MSSVRRVLLTIAVGAAVGAGPAIAAPAMATHNRHRDFAAILNGSRVVVQPGTTADADAWGAANVRVFSRGRLCYSLYTRNLGTGIDAKIFESPRGDANAAVDARVTLDTVGRWGSGCEWIGKELAWKIMKNPSGYNVQVNSSTGAIRGQLFRNSNNHNW